MPKKWDSACKMWIRAAAKPVVTWLAGGQATFLETLSIELRDIELNVDGLIKVQLNGQKAVFHIECQTYYDEKMPLRLLRYNIEAQWEHELPVYSFVLHLLGDKNIADSPLHLEMPDGRRILDFEYQRIELSELPADELRQANIPEILPCLPSMKGGARRDYVEYMAEELARTGNADLEVVGFAFASLAFQRRQDDQNWLLKRFHHMQDILRDTPIMQEILSLGREEGREEGKGIGKEITQKVLLSYIEAHFPEIKRFAEQQIAKLKELESLGNLAVKVTAAQTESEIRHLLSSCTPVEQ